MNKKPDHPNQLRAAAEAKLARAPKPKPRPAEELLHELEVYQVELEMQNEQLRQAQVELEESRDRYVDLYEFAPVGYLTLTDTGMISEINLTGATLLKVERSKLLHQRFITLVAPEHRDRWHRLFVRVLQHAGSQNSELTLKNGAGESLQVYLDCMNLVTDGKPPVVRIALTDITERKETVRSLRESEFRWKFALEGAGDGVWDWDMQAGRVVFSERYKEMLGYAGDEAWNSLDEWRSRVNGEDMHHAMQELEAYMDGKRAVYTAEYRMRCKDGSWKWMLVRGMVVSRTADGRPLRMIGTHTDITAHKQAEQQLRDLTAHFQTVREEEKASIAREIHDDLGGTLTALKMEAYWLAEELSASMDNEPLLKHVELMSQLTDHAVNVTRRVITGLRPTILDDLGLLAALEWQAGQFCKLTGIQCKVNSIEDKVNLDKQRSIALFRIFQESLTNVAKHSGASRVAVEFRCGDEEVMLSVCDNGCGLPDGHTVAPTSYGMRGMCERVKQLDGKIKFDSPLGGGFCVTVTLPPYADNKIEQRT